MLHLRQLWDLSCKYYWTHNLFITNFDDFHGCCINVLNVNEGFRNQWHREDPIDIITKLRSISSLCSHKHNIKFLRGMKRKVTYSWIQIESDFDRDIQKHQSLVSIQMLKQIGEEQKMTNTLSLPDVKCCFYYTIERFNVHQHQLLFIPTFQFKISFQHSNRKRQHRQNSVPLFNGRCSRFR